VKREAVSTQRAPAAVGPYSQAIRAGGLVFASGQLGLDPATGKLRDGLEEQARQALTNLAAVLESAGASMATVVKTTLFLVDISQFATVNSIYGTFFPDPPPARSTVQVAALPLGGLVEIEAVALGDTPASASEST
jgi:2-iminobutanoate/2-iminopropanoate deaminase